MTEAFAAHGGIQQFNRDFLTALDNSGHSGVVIVRNAANQTVQVFSDTKQIRMRSKLAYSIRSIAVTYQYKPDILFCGHINLMPIAKLLGRIFNIPIWFHGHGIEIWELTKIQRKSLGSAKLLTAVSRYSMQQLRSQMPSAYRYQFAVLPNTVRAEFRPSTKTQSCHRGQTSIRLLIVGRLNSMERYKGHDWLINNLGSLRDRVGDVQLTIVGDGDDKQRLQFLTKQLGLSDWVNFMGQVDEQQLQEALFASDLFVMPSTGEGFGIVYLEAMSAGLPAIGLVDKGSRDPLEAEPMGAAYDQSELFDKLVERIQAIRNGNVTTQQGVQVFTRANFDAFVGALASRFSPEQPDEQCIN